MSETLNFLLKAEEAKIRRRWLIAALLKMLLPFLLEFVVHILAQANDLSYQPVEMNFLVFLPELIPTFAIGLLIYFVYCKYGTAYLTFFLFACPMLLFEDGAALTSVLSDDLPAVFLGVAVFTIVSELILVSYLFWISFKVLKINKLVKRRKIESSTSYQQALSILEQAVDSSDLNQKFRQIVTHSRSKEIMKDVSKAYQKRKRELEYV